VTLTKDKLESYDNFTCKLQMNTSWMLNTDHFRASSEIKFYLSVLHLLVPSAKFRVPRED